MIVGTELHFAAAFHNLAIDQTAFDAMQPHQQAATILDRFDTVRRQNEAGRHSPEQVATWLNYAEHLVSSYGLQDQIRSGLTENPALGSWLTEQQEAFARDGVQSLSASVAPTPSWETPELNDGLAPDSVAANADLTRGPYATLGLEQEAFRNLPDNQARAEQLYLSMARLMRQDVPAEQAVDALNDIMRDYGDPDLATALRDARDSLEPGHPVTNYIGSGGRVLGVRDFERDQAALKGSRENGQPPMAALPELDPSTLEPDMFIDPKSGVLMPMPYIEERGSASIESGMEEGALMKALGPGFKELAVAPAEPPEEGFTPTQIAGDLARGLNVRGA